MHCQSKKNCFLTTMGRLYVIPAFKLILQVTLFKLSIKLFIVYHHNTISLTFCACLCFVYIILPGFF